MDGDPASILDIVLAGREILEFVGAMTRIELKRNRMAYAAVQRNLEIMGEATKRLSLEIRQSLPQIPWKEMAGMLDILAHRYEEIEIDIVWVAIKKRIPEILQILEPLCPSSPPERPTT